MWCLRTYGGEYCVLCQGTEQSTHAPAWDWTLQQTCHSQQQQLSRRLQYLWVLYYWWDYYCRVPKTNLETRHTRVNIYNHKIFLGSDFNSDRKYRTSLIWFMVWTQWLESFIVFDIFKNCHRESHIHFLITQVWWSKQLWTLMAQRLYRKYHIPKEKVCEMFQIDKNICFQQNAPLLCA